MSALIRPCHDDRVLLALEQLREDMIRAETLVITRRRAMVDEADPVTGIRERRATKGQTIVIEINGGGDE